MLQQICDWHFGLESTPFSASLVVLMLGPGADAVTVIKFILLGLLSALIVGVPGVLERHTLFASCGELTLGSVVQERND